MLALLFRRNPGSTDAQSSFSLPYHFSRANQPFTPGVQLVITIWSGQTTNVANSCTCAHSKTRMRNKHLTPRRQDAKERSEDSSVARLSRWVKHRNLPLSGSLSYWSTRHEAQSPLVLAPMATAVHGRNIPKAPRNCSGLAARGAQRNSRRYRRILSSFLYVLASWREIFCPL